MIMAYKNPPTTTKKLEAPTGDYEQFLYSVSHDLQEPLRMVNSFLKLLDGKVGESLDEDSRKYLDYTIENADRMKGMIYALVELSRVNRSSEQIESVDLNEVIMDLTGMFENNIVSHQAVISSTALPHVMMIPGQAVDLFKILLQNAFDNKGTRPLEIHISNKMVGDRVEISVKDNGIGIKPVYLDKVFEMFKRTDARSEKLGSGLAIAREIIKKYGGTILLESTQGVVTTFTFTLPVVTI